MPSLPLGQRLATSGIFVLLGSAALALSEAEARGRTGRVAHTWLLALGLDAAAHVFVVVEMSGAGRPFLLLAALPVLVWGVVRGLPGGLIAAGITALVPLANAVPALERAGPWLSAQAGAGLSAAAALLLLGLCSGFLGRRLHRAEEAHRATRRELERTKLDAETIVACLSNGLLCLDAEGSIRRVNARVVALLGDHPALVVGGDLRTVAQDASLAPLAEHLIDSLQWSWEATAEVELHGLPLAADRAASVEEGLPLEVTTAPILGADGSMQGLVVLLADLTERRGRDRDEKRQEKLAWIGQLSAGLAHEIRNSLKPITGSVELLRDELSRSESAAPSKTGLRLMDIILREAEALEGFLTEFLSFARDKTLKLESVSLESMVEEECPGLETLVRRRIRFSKRGEAPLPARVDPGALRQVLRNLALNAAEAGNGDLEVEVGRDGRSGVITVRDHGEGIPLELRDRVFDPFFTTKAHGTGLGLAIARDLVDRHGGSIRLEPADGGGTRARVRLPLAA